MRADSKEGVMDRNERITLTADSGGGKHADVEIGASDTAWIAIDPGFEGADLWLKADGAGIDLRLRVRRNERGIEVRIDRGAEERRWWAAEAVPRLVIAIDPDAQTATAFAATGNAQSYQQVTLGQTAT
jgi:hypothetical protein